MIKHIQIKGFWEEYTIDWHPHPDVNILVGINGSGKSTLLKILKRALANATPAVGITLLIQGDGIDIDCQGSRYACDCKCYFVKTFDEVIKEAKESKSSFSPLTEQLRTIIYDTQGISLNSYRLKATEPQTAVRTIERLQEWQQVVNELFATTGKTLEIQGNTVFFKQADKKIELEQLSSGEKQLLIILTNILTQDREPSVLLMDEPEISLDVDWQYKLINTIRQLNPNCQLFIATHSPSIFGDGWNDKLIFMEDLLSKEAYAKA